MENINNSVSTRLIGSEIHGFHTMADLDVGNTMEEAKSRWLRPNEIHAILCNHKHFTINVKPVNLPKSGRIVLFDRKMLRNFRKDGHNWKKKKDGKTVKEAHEHLKVGNDERIHVYYAHGEDNTTFVRRCYWLLDKSLEHIVLVHYRETQESQASPVTPGNSNSSSGLSEISSSWPLSEESDSVLDRPYYDGAKSLLGQQNGMNTKNHEQRLHEINTLEWEELLAPNNSQEVVITSQEEKLAGFEQLNQYQMNSYLCSGDESYNKIAGLDMINNLPALNSGLVPLSGADTSHNLGKDSLQTQDSFGRWMTRIITDSAGSADNQALETSISNELQSVESLLMDNHGPTTLGQTFNITDVSPASAISTEHTKILVVGFFNGGQLSSPESTIFLVCGDSILPVEVVQAGVFRCYLSPQTPGLVNLYLTFDGHKPISQVLNYEFHAPVVINRAVTVENKSNWEDFQVQMRLARLLFSSSKSLAIFSTKLNQNALKEAKVFTQKTSHISDSWVYLTKMVGDTKMPIPRAKDSLFELILQNKLQEWLLEQVVAECRITERDEQGLGVIHLCAILGYTWAVYPYSCAGLSLDYRDKFGWTALHWAAHFGREKMVATLLSAGAKPNLVTDPTTENPGGCTVADIACKNGYEGLGAFLAEKALVAQFNDMTLAGNVSGTLQTTTNETVNHGEYTEDEMYLKDTLAAYRNAAGAAARIQAAFREHSFKVRTLAVESSSPEDEARNIVAAMRIQHAFRNYDTRKKIAAAARIQCRFRTWKIRRDFLNLRSQAIRIQSIFRGYQVRRHYRKICWSVGILEKAILRWRLRRKGFRGLQVDPTDEFLKDPNQDSDVEEDFFQASRKQAEERVERSVVRVQAMFRSKRAQEEYRRMKLEHDSASLEYEWLLHPDTNMG